MIEDPDVIGYIQYVLFNPVGVESLVFAQLPI